MEYPYPLYARNYFGIIEKLMFFEHHTLALLGYFFTSSTGVKSGRQFRKRKCIPYEGVSSGFCFWNKAEWILLIA